MIKLLKIKFQNHPVLDDSEINFADPNEQKNSKYISLIIGQNGAGKTQVLRAIVDLFLALHDHIYYDKDSWTANYNFKADIYKDGKILSIISRDGGIWTQKGKKIGEKYKFSPSKLVVSAYTFNDKLPKIDNSDFYYYGGLKTTSNNIFLNIPAQDTFKNLAKIVLNSKHRVYLNELFEELGFERKLKVRYKHKNNYKKFIGTKVLWTLMEDIRKKKDHSIDQLELDSFRRLLVQVTAKKPARYNKSYKEDTIARTLKSDKKLRVLLQYCVKHLQGVQNMIRINQLRFEFEYTWDQSIAESMGNDDFVSHLDAYDTFSALGILSFDKFYVSRKEFFSFDEASSGEFHLLHLISSIMANIEENSIILIDEPEISLHFNWQNKFFKLLEPITTNYTSCHFIIATHSHFLVSNLKKSSSSIISMKREGSILKIGNLSEIDTEGWSAEQILFDVFNVASDRNYYMSLLVEEIVKEMSSVSPRIGVIRKKKKLLAQHDLGNLNDNDPFKTIIKKILAHEIH